MSNLGFCAVVVVGAAINHGPVQGVLVLALWPLYAWGAVAIHEAGHAVAARLTGNEVSAVVVGTGLVVAATRRIQLSAVPLVGRTEWLPNPALMTSRRELLITVAGPAANVLAAALFACIGLLQGGDLWYVLAGLQVLTGMINLLPASGGLHGRGMPSDGARLWSLLRGMP